MGYARPTMIERAENQPDALYRELARQADEQVAARTRKRPENVKKRIVIERQFKVIRPLEEEIVEFEYQPVKFKKTYRVIALRKRLAIEQGQIRLFDDVRYFFYITNDRDLSADEVVYEARNRCNQENLIEQLKNGVRALHAPVNTLEANWAYMLMTALAWNLKAWLALLLPISPRWGRSTRNSASAF
ncbi:MAG TPA: transposase [Thermoanaerobaculia bacterium]|nr:transposase [Thermoanaerobaculia bacterium]